jgi:hypothetical protein
MGLWLEPGPWSGSAKAEPGLAKNTGMIEQPIIKRAANLAAEFAVILSLN